MPSPYTAEQLRRSDVAGMEPSDTAVILSMMLEGVSLKAYKDVGGRWTVGYGTTDNVGPGTRITVAQAHAMMYHDLQTAAAGVKQHVTVQLAQNEFDALVLFVNNVGVHAFATSTLLRLLNAGQRNRAWPQLYRWCHVHGTVIRGLVKRRKIEYELATHAETPTV